MMNDLENVVTLLQSGTVNVFSLQELRKKLETGKPLKIK